MKKKRASLGHSKAFTIVELLVVVVVIAILATITIISYNGIQQRATNSTIVSAVDNWDKVIKAAAIDGASMPAVGTCLGRSGDFTAKNGFPSGACVLVDGSPAANVSFDESQYSSWPTSIALRRPSGELPVVSYSTGGSQIKTRGLWVGSLNAAGRTIEVRWLSQVDGQCAKGVALSAPIVGSLTGGYCALNISY